jgi:glycerol-3-phosphate O-acyltransferase/dihydroxyacetone phosphate acyltransferase
LPPDTINRSYRAARAIARFWVWFFFKSVDVRHPEHVPGRGPVLLCINHPNNLIDSLLVAAVLRRQVHYLATATLFRNPVLARFLRACGALPVYRRQDDADKMDRNAEVFQATFAALARGHTVAIYPEGTTHAEARVQRIKTGAARLALGYEAHRPGSDDEVGLLELAVVPVGLTFEARKSFRGRVLVSFGSPLPVQPYVKAYREDPVKAVTALTEAIQHAMEGEVVNVSSIDATSLVRAVEALYGADLVRELQTERGLGEGQIDRLRLSRAIVDAVDHFKATDPERVERLWQRVQCYRALLTACRLRDEAVRARLEREPLRGRVRRGWEAVIGLPFFAYGMLVNGLPYGLPRLIAHRVSRKETDYATARFLAAVVAFPLFWAFETWIVWRLTSLRGALLFAVSLPISGVIAYRYLAGAGRMRARLRFARLRIWHEAEARRLLSERAQIIVELERAKSDYLAATKGSTF